MQLLCVCVCVCVCVCAAIAKIKNKKKLMPSHKKKSQGQKKEVCSDTEEQNTEESLEPPASKASPRPLDHQATPMTKTAAAASDMAQEKVVAASSAPSAKKNAHHPASHQPSAPISGRQTLCRRVNAVVMGVIIPIGKKRKVLNRNRVCIGLGNAEDTTSSSGPGRRRGVDDDRQIASEVDGLPRKVSFLYTEDDALRKAVRRMVKDCPRLCMHEDRECFLVKLMQMLEEVAED